MASGERRSHRMKFECHNERKECVCVTFSMKIFTLDESKMFRSHFKSLISFVSFVYVTETLAFAERLNYQNFLWVLPTSAGRDLRKITSFAAKPSEATGEIHTQQFCSKFLLKFLLRHKNVMGVGGMRLILAYFQTSFEF